MKNIIEQLSESEHQQLVKQERVLAKGFTHMHAAADALRVIRDKRLYREHGTFQEYCEKKWGRERQTVNRMLAAWDVKSKIGAHVHHSKPLKNAVETTSDRALRTLAKVPKKEQMKVFKKAVKISSGKAPTARTILSVAHGPCAEFSHPPKAAQINLPSAPQFNRGRESTIKDFTDYYTSAPAAAAVQVAAPEPMVADDAREVESDWKARMLAAYDYEIANNLDAYNDFKEMAERIRAVLEAL